MFRLFATAPHRWVISCTALENSRAFPVMNRLAGDPPAQAAGCGKGRRGAPFAFPTSAVRPTRQAYLRSLALGRL